MAELGKTHELHKRRLGRNTGVALLLGLFVVLSIAVSVVKIGNSNSELENATEEASE